MAKITRYQGDLEGFSSSAVGQERVIFGDIGATQSDDLTDNINSDFLRGWGSLPLGNKPPREWFNSVHWVSTQLSAYLHQMGVAEWHVEQEYYADSLCTFNGGLFKSKVDVNVGNSPYSSPVEWQLISTDIVTTTQIISSSLNPSVGAVITTNGFGSEHDGGGASWRATGNTIAAGQLPSDTGNATLSDADGNEFELVPQITSSDAEINIKALGAVGAIDHTAVFQAAINSIASSGNIILGSGSYNITTVNIPQGKLIGFIGKSFRTTKIIGIGGAVPVINYQRTSGQAGSVITLEKIEFLKLGLDKEVGSRALNWQGFGVLADDNWIKAELCSFQGFEYAISSGFSGQTVFDKCYFRDNVRSFSLTRGASFWTLSKCFSFDATFLHADDATADAYSNGITINECSCITATSECVFVRNWQAVFISDCGWDLGSGGTAAVHFIGVMDSSITSCYISGDGVAVRDGVLLDNCVRASIRSNTLVNNKGAGIQVVGASSLATRVTIDDNRFDGNGTNDIIFTSNVSASKVKNNHHSKQFSRTGTEFEIFANTTGTDFNIIKDNTFSGASYSILAGANSIIADNIFDTPAG